VDRGFFGKLKVRQVQGGPGISPIQRVVASVNAGEIAFGVDSPENILRAREKEDFDLVALSVDFQESAMRIISWNPIKSSREIRGDFGIWMGYEAKARCVVGRGREKQFTIQTQGEDLTPWLSGTWPMASAMTYSDLILARREVRRMGRKFFTVDYRDLGVNWMDNVLFTTEEVIRKHPDVVQAVVTGRYRGFQWALNHPLETFDILKRNHEGLDAVREMDAVDPVRALLVTPETRRKGLGHLLPEKWQSVAKNLFKAGLLKRMPDVEKIYTDKFPSGVMPR
jgi:NitT/TauT family transport system substrate-binding protein